VVKWANGGEMERYLRLLVHNFAHVSKKGSIEACRGDTTRLRMRFADADADTDTESDFSYDIYM